MTKISTQKITPFLWYDHQAKEAATFYCSLFENSRIISSSDMVMEFELEGLQFMALNGGPKYRFTEANSFLVLCENQQEVDHFWNALTSDGGEESMCGWCKDRFGLSWQIIPERFMEIMKTGTPDQVQRVMKVMIPMHKLIIEEFESVLNG